MYEGGSSYRWATRQLGIPESLPHQLRPNRVAFVWRFGLGVAFDS